MSTQNFSNNISMQPVQNNVPVQYVNNYPVAPQMQTAVPLPCTQIPQNNNYIPRYMPYIQNGQVYSAPVPQQIQPVQQGPKSGNVSAVNITINGVNQPGQPAQMPQAVPTCLPYYVPQPPVNNIPAQEIKKEPEVKNEPLAASKVEEKPEVKKSEVKEEKKVEEKNHKKAAAELTDEYIQKLEKNLTDKDKDVRLHAAAELVNRFKEDETRKNDKKLTSLLNLALQDDSKPVVFGVMQAIENGYAEGNETTKQRLQEIVNKKDTFGNSETAEGLLTKMSGKKAGAETLNASTPIKNEENTTDVPEKKLDLAAE